MDSSWKLSPHPIFQGPEGPLVLVVMDGVGLGKGDESDAVALAQTSTLDFLIKSRCYTALRAHGIAVGMPSDSDMGNSEVGHNALGAGRVFAQGALRVNDAITDGSIFRSETWKWLTEPCCGEARALHFVGLLSDGNVHSHINHLIAMLREADRLGIQRVNVHPLLDGRDVPQTSAHIYLEQLEEVLAEINEGDARQYQIASGGGRMKVTMDRYGADYSIVERGWKAHVKGVGRPFPNALNALETFREETPGILDQDLPEFVIVRDGAPVGRIEEGDSVVLFNFRGDRAIELTQAFETEDYAEFERGSKPDVRFAGMMQYDGDLLLPTRYLVSPPAIDRTMGEYLARNRVPQFAISETQKFGHVTYFWNGNRSGKFDPEVETYEEIPSDRISFDQKPEMKAAEITERVLEVIKSGGHRFIRLNYANGDMVGHTGRLEPTIQAVEAVNRGLERLKEAVEAARGILVVTADHGNADEMYMRKKSGEIDRDANGQPKAKTSHTLNPVPFLIYDPSGSDRFSLNPEIDSPGLANVAATVLNLLGLEAPEGYEPSLVVPNPNAA